MSGIIRAFEGYISAAKAGEATHLRAPIEKVEELVAAVKPRIITTQAELDALPVASVVANTENAYPDLWMKNWESAHPRKDGTPLSKWVGGMDWDIETETKEITLPVTVLLEAPAERKSAA